MRCAAGAGRQRARDIRRAGLAGETVHLKGRDGETVPATLTAARLGRRSGCDATVAIFRVGDDEGIRNEFHRRLEALSAVFDGAPDGVLVLDRSHFVTWANSALE